MAGRRYWLVTARKALGLTQCALAELLSVDVGTVSRWEVGARAPSLGQMQRIAKVLKLCPGDVLQGFGVLSDTASLGTISSSQTFRDSSTPFPIHDIPPPKSVTTSDVEQVRTAVMQLSMLASECGSGGLVRLTGHAHLRWASALLSVECAAQVRSELTETVAWLAVVIGGVALDLHEQHEAQAASTFVLRCAEETNNWHLRAAGHVMLALQCAAARDPDSALTHVELAAARADRLNSDERAVLRTMRSHYLSELTAAEEGAGATSAPRIRPWIAFCTQMHPEGNATAALAAAL